MTVYTLKPLLASATNIAFDQKITILQESGNFSRHVSMLCCRGQRQVHMAR